MTVHSAANRKGDGVTDKRERILDAAEQIFARHGFYAAKVSDVAKEAGVADGTIYLYFKSKDELLISLFERRMHQLNAALKAAIAGKHGRAALEAFIRCYVQLLHDEPAATEVLTIELRQSSKFMKEYDNPEFVDFLRTLGGIIAAAQEAGELYGNVPSHIAARMIFGILDELALAWVLARARPTNGGATAGSRPKKFDIVRAADWIVALVTTGLVLDKESA
jgi:TetR/AcrR family transcriptional regulator, fatty acid metabolism regulator protein